MLKGLGAYTLCSGIISEDLNGGEYCAVPLTLDDTMEIGYLKKEGIPLSPLGLAYLEELKKIYQQP